ncbi:AlpA family transcriptional regulator [Salmonella enterica]|nr:AlpA family transcriptional regulator [Salmonella enterica]EMD4701107.1 AlpA family transcriptional regulator [Salmonella enterica]EMD5018667.1 AlpA family transcriptional regulator [Salmonella enterica]
MMSHQLLRLKQVEAKTGIKRSQIYLYMQRGSFPRSIKIGPASVAWLESEIDEWISRRLADRCTKSGS